MCEWVPSCVAVAHKKKQENLRKCTITGETPHKIVNKTDDTENKYTLYNITPDMYEWVPYSVGVVPMGKTKTRDPQESTTQKETYHKFEDKMDDTNNKRTFYNITPEVCVVPNSMEQLLKRTKTKNLRK